jgi:two-component system OmpR family response regulator
MSQEKIRMFIVDDHEPTLQMMKKLMEKKQAFQVHAFDSGEACLNNISLNPEIILLDFELFGSGGRMNGLDVVRKLHESQIHPKIVMLTGQDNGNMVLSLIQLGIRDYIIKDENAFVELESIITEFIENRKSGISEAD